MTYFGALNCIPGLQSAADLSSYQFRFMKYSAANKVTFQNATGGMCVGVLQNKPAAASRAAAVAGFNGTLTKVVSGASVSAGADVMSDTVGRAITHTSGGYYKLGVALSASTGAGQLIDVILINNGMDINVATGTIQLDICALREIVSNDIGDSVADESGAGTAQGGGYLTNQTTPLLQRANTSTDKCLRVAWAASDSTEVQFPTIILPADLDSASDMTVHLYAKMAGSTDTPTVDCQVFFNEGDTECGAASTALGATLAEETATVSAANIPAAPGVMNLSLVPGAHTTDILYLYGAWIEYVRAVK